MPHHRITFAVVLIATAAFSMLVSLVVPVLPMIQQDLGTDQGTITWVLTAYLLAASVATPIVGRIGDSYGKKRTLVAVLAVFAAGTVLAALARSVDTLIAARAIQGIGGAILPLGFGILRDELPPARVASAREPRRGHRRRRRRPRHRARRPDRLHGLGYHFIFWIPLVVRRARGGRDVLRDPRVPRPVRHADRRAPPAVLLAATLVALLLPVSQGHAWGWTATRTLVLLAAAVAFGAAWIRWSCAPPAPSWTCG